MSRSYKKFPLSRMVLWGRSMKKGKQYSNRKIRRKLKRNPEIDVGNGHHYKRLGLDSWDLWEYKSLQTKEDAISEWESTQKHIANGVPKWKGDYSLKDTINDWEKFHKRK